MQINLIILKVLHYQKENSKIINLFRLEFYPKKLIESLLMDKEIKKNIKLLTRYKNFILVIINNEISKSKNDTDVTLRYYGLGAQIIKDFKVKV